MAGTGRGNTLPPEIRALKNDKAHAYLYKDIEYPQSAKDLASPPEHLSERAKQIFIEIRDRINRMYHCSSTYTEALVLYANNQEELEHLENYLRKNGHSYEDKKFIKTGKDTGIETCTIKKRPESDIYKCCKEYAKQMLIQFGLTGSARSKINMKALGTPDKAEQNPFTAFGKPKLIVNN